MLKGNYYPGKLDDWKYKKPAEVGMDPKVIEEAVKWANENEVKQSRDLVRDRTAALKGRRCDDGKILGPMKNRGGPNGLVIKNGYIVAEWGDTRQIDMTFSATKSYIATCVGLAFDRGMIGSVHDPVKKYVTDGKFDPPHNSKITWHHLLQQTNEWDGTLWDKHYSADAHTDESDIVRDPKEPGTWYEYNDVRVNLIAYSALQVWRRPLPQVLKELIMDPVGASNTWRWYGYDNSWVLLDGQMVQSVSGGGHWGGGLQISARDHARFGYLLLRRGKWEDKQLVSEKWIDMCNTPGDVNPVYGYLWWLNPEHTKEKEATEQLGPGLGRYWKGLPGTPYNSFSARGAGGNWVWVDPDDDLLIVTRWMNEPGTFIRKVLSAIK
jgi:CubicO group peptidase (beta-lactamase class C family)